jgi:hypothetical protein
MRCANTTASQALKRLPPTDPDDFAPCWRSERPSRQRSVPGLGHPGLMFDTRSHTSLCARHTALRLFIEARRATCRLWDSATKTIFEHTHAHSKPPHPAASCHLSSDSAPCEAPPAELPQPRGCAAPTLHNHHHATARAVALPQPDLARTPPVAS